MRLRGYEATKPQGYITHISQGCMSVCVNDIVIGRGRETLRISKNLNAGCNRFFNGNDRPSNITIVSSLLMIVLVPFFNGLLISRLL